MPAPSEQAPPDLIAIYVDADACPVKAEIYRVAGRQGLKVFVVANSSITTPREGWIERVIVDAAPDAADDWIAARAGPGAIVITADVPLASRCIKAGADVIGPTGKPFTQNSIGLALATRNLFDELRAQGDVTGGGPKPFSPRDRSAFLSALDLAIVRLRRRRTQLRTPATKKPRMARSVPMGRPRRSDRYCDLFEFMLLLLSLLFGSAPLCVPGLASMPGAPAPEGAFISSAERPSCFWIAVLGSAFLPAAGPDELPEFWAIATPPRSRLADESAISMRVDMAVLLCLLKCRCNHAIAIWLPI